MDLFELRNNRALPSVHALMIEPYKSMWEKDLDPDKFECIRIFSYVELVCSPKKSNPYSGYAEEDRPKRVKKEIFGDLSYNSPIYTVGDIIGAIEKYKEFLNKASQSYSLLISAENAAVKLQDFLDSFDLSERTRAGTPVYKPRDIQVAIDGISDTMRKLKELKNKVNDELSEESRTRNSREIGAYER